MEGPLRKGRRGRGRFLIGITAAVLAAGGVGMAHGIRREPPRAILHVGEGALAVELARTPEARASGLSRRASLPEHAGMLFAFPDAAIRTIWMKDMLFPLDVVWIRDGRVVGVSEHVRPEPGVPDSALRRSASQGPVDRILEVNAGWTARHGVRMGDRAVLQRFPTRP